MKQEIEGIDEELVESLARQYNGLVKTRETECLYRETLTLYGWQKYRGKSYRPFYGVGVVYRVVKGENNDLVYVRFGCFPHIRRRVIVAFHNHARRQTLALKRGQCCQVYGVCRYYTTEFVDKETQEKKKQVRLGLYAISINAWYVPTMIDIRRLPKNEDVVDPTDNEKKLFETFDDVMQDFMSGNGEEE